MKVSFYFSIAYFQEASRVSGFLNGEWERSHIFVCGACNTKFLELREALEHKWDDHPYCLVAHFTLHNQLNLPPSEMMYPQLGRGMANNRGVKVVGNKTSMSLPTRKPSMFTFWSAGVMWTGTRPTKRGRRRQRSLKTWEV